MDGQNKKLAILRQLSQEAEPISLSELLQKLKDNHAERSVRRWLMQLTQEGLVEKVGSRKGARYRVVQRSQRPSVVSGKYFSPKSEEAINFIRRPVFERTPTAYVDEWIDSYQPNISFYIPSEIRNQLHQAGQRSQGNDPAGTYAHQIFNRLLIDLSYNSSRLEGNTYTLLDTQKLIIEGTGAEGKLDEEKIMILNHKEAIRYLVDSAPKLRISDQTICTLHYLLSDSLVEARYAGKIRDHSVRVGGSTYIPYEDSKQLQIRLNRIAEKSDLIDNPYEQSLFVLAHISYLQAFSDVNKRTARLTANIPLIKNNLVPLSFNDVERDDYTSALLAVYELQDIRPLHDLFVFSYMRTCAMYDSTVRTMGYDEIRVRYRQQRRQLIRDIILNGLIGEALSDYISSHLCSLVKEEDRAAVIKDIEDDLQEINESRLFGLGVTPDELRSWLEKRKCIQLL